jgi:transcriptional regulator with PAS, ATPase and Fis domain
LRVNVRLIAATNRDIVAAIREGNFREDLFHRLNVVQFRLPPLRERGEDVLILAEHFLKHFNAGMNKHVKGISRGARQKLLSHHWPGNVRELKNVIERALILESVREIQAASLPDFKLEAQLHKTASPQVSGDQSLDELLANFERDLINAMLERNNFSLTRTAEQLKLSRHALRYRMQRLSISTATDDDEDKGVTTGKEGPV